MESPLYREARESDLIAICELGQVVNAIHHAAHPGIFAPQSSAERDAEHWRQSCFGLNSTAFVAEFGGAVVGFVNAAVVNENHTLLQPVRFVRVGSVSVAESCRGRGIGRELMSMVERWAAAQGATDIRLNVWAFNESARRLYQEIGYEVRSLFMGKAVGSHESEGR